MDFEIGLEYRDQLLSVWAQLAERYKNRSKLICYEILNEPHGITDELWNDIQQQAIDTIRSIAPTHIIVIGPANWNSYENLDEMPEYNDPNLIYTFHFYDPGLVHTSGGVLDGPRVGRRGECALSVRSGADARHARGEFDWSQVERFEITLEYGDIHSKEFSIDQINFIKSSETNVRKQFSGDPSWFTLDQNYPNPFNPTTKIKYTLPQCSHVRLTIFNIMGQKVCTLVDAIQEAGIHRVEWNQAHFDVSSGIYFCYIDVERGT
ncbi:cellulase family glycosylhydrolase [candidate division KSB1 bacterium]|nr:cellulase family glycosylhydrolase [candidate division KSB1 bacterium]